MDNLLETTQQLVAKHMVRIIIFIFTMMIGMVIGQSFAHAQTKTASPSPAAATKGPMPLVMGTLTTISPESITMTDGAGTSHTFAIASTTKFDTFVGKTKPTIKTLKADDSVAVAYTDPTTATGIFLVPATLPAAKQTSFLGVVSSREASTSGIILSLKNPKEDDFAKALVTSKTTVTAKGLDKPTMDDIKAGDKVLLVGPSSTTSNLITTLKAYLIPGKARGLLDKITVSSTPSATKAATTSGTKTSTNSGTR